MEKEQETFYCTFHMNNGNSIDIKLNEHPSFDLSFVLETNGKWFKHEDRIINLDNVNFIKVETHSEREEQRRFHNEAKEEFLNIKF
ncbi:hypothetical protein ACUXCC_003464 [Cytobacillus horneckiae]|uniref:hypothetical protein n=1 Tax=Cytobacillus horneckiae TaxID=549687 RepID=UPI0019D044D8|nr:hypothetical protein [Cytobacillus horneckiae]MBN6889912.1 hypothetical protein [Cytobacillus horneckiae]